MRSRNSLALCLLLALAPDAAAQRAPVAGRIEFDDGRTLEFHDVLDLSMGADRGAVRVWYENTWRTVPPAALTSLRVVTHECGLYEGRSWGRLLRTSVFEVQTRTGVTAEWSYGAHDQPAEPHSVLVKIRDGLTGQLKDQQVMWCEGRTLLIRRIVFQS